MVYYATLDPRSIMKLQHWMAIVVTLLVFGCRAPAPTTQPAPALAGPEEIQRIRASYKAQDPNVEVGVVEDVLDSENLALVGDINLANYKEGGTVCFIDSAA